jgi:ferredoxin
MERNPEYRSHVGLSLPIELIEQRWRKTSKQLTVSGEHQIVNGERLTVNGQQPKEFYESLDLPEPSHMRGGKYHIATQAALPRNAPFAKFAIDRSEQCISCGQCVEACVYDVHLRNPLDLRRMNTPKDELCRACFRCIQECPRNALAISLDSNFSRAGRGIFNADVILSLQNQAVEGKIPVQGAGYRGAFAGEAFDSMWTDMSEIVRPTRRNTWREYISTTVDLGRREQRLEIARLGFSRYVEIPLPILFNELPIHRSRNVLLAVARAARRLGTYAIIARRDWFQELAPYARNIAISVDDNEIDGFITLFDLIEVDNAELVPRVKSIAPNAIVIARIREKLLAAERIVQLAREGAEIIHLAFDPVEPRHLFEELPRVHSRLVEEGLRDAVTIVASGAIAMAEHAPKTVILGADAVAIDLPLVIAMECVLDEQCFADDACTKGAEAIDPSWGEQRIVNLVASWRNQLLEVMGAMGMREVRRLRGERGRAMLKSELDEKLLEPIFAK